MNPYQSSIQARQYRESEFTSNYPEQGQLSLTGIPGVPFSKKVEKPPLYFQGEDVFFDTILYVENKIVTSDKWIVSAIVKPTKYLYNPIWKGVHGAGIYDGDGPGQYVVGITANYTKGWAAGTYWLDIVIQEKIGDGGISDRTIVLARSCFDLEYSVSSPLPETRESGTVGFNRNDLPSSSPPAASTL